MNSASDRNGDSLEVVKGFSGWRILDVTIVILSLVMVVYHFVYVRVLVQDAVLHANTHLGFGLVITFLIMIRKNHRFWHLKLLLALLSVVCFLYVQFFYIDLAYRISFNTLPDLIIGIILIMVCLIACTESAGLVLPVIAGIFILYAFFGYVLPGPLQAMQMDWKLIVSRLALSFGISGIYGYLLTISATLIFMFMVFAMLVTATGAVSFFTMIGDWVSQRFSSGPAMAAVCTSALVGSVSGLPGPNVMITGSFTIPAMKRAGYTPEHAGGIETAASTCGPIVPPVMGIVAFVMVGFTGIPYKDIVAIAILPALLYVFSAALYVTFQAGNLGIQRTAPIKVDRRELLLRCPIFFGPLIVLTILLLLEFSPMLAAFWGTILLVVISLIRPSTRPSLSTFIEGLCRGAEIGSRVAAMCAVLGLVIITITMTGLGVKLPSAVANLVGDNLLLLLVLTGAICILLGCGIPTSAAYLLVAITCAPMLLKQGVPLLQAHFFVLYAAVFANITPPIAIPAIFASQIAGGQYMKTAFQAAFAGIAGFLLPFMIIFVPSLTFSFSEPFFAITSLIACPLIFIGLQPAIVGYFMKRLGIGERVVIILSPAALMAYIYTAHFVWFSIGVIILAAFTAWQTRVVRRGKSNIR
ncbi:MAG: TRAP transporter fused permease subunit [Deltaproteobacteria bacterium]|nr:MAG: TRAP transporter fused permease subunit [Deltaproteobacteria bacterium]